MVTPDRAGWAVERSGERVALFPTSQPAIDYACDLARRDAADGRLALVTSRTLPEEFHCYVPPGRATGFPPPYPRLVASR